MKYNKTDISSGISLISVNAGHFKTSEASVSLAMPLSRETAAVNALIINMLSRKNSRYPTMAVLNKRLAGLYGAELSAEVCKLGDNQILSISAECVDDRFSLDGESISLECIKLLVSLILEPRLDENGDFYTEDIEAEKRLLIEQIEAENNEKRVYALRQTERIMFKDEVYGTNKYGDIESIKKIDKQQCINAYRQIIKKAKIMIVAIGGADEKATATYIGNEFSKIGREYTGINKTQFVPQAKEVKEELERIDVNQGKLVLGFRVNLEPQDKLTTAMRLFCDIFGGGPYSKLFANVREKMSLCYYCSAGYVKQKSYIVIQCGCNEDNMDKAVSEILNQLDIIKSGDFDEELSSSKISVKDTLSSCNDVPSVLEQWYAGQITLDGIKTPEQEIDEIDKVTKEQIMQCAQLLTLDTVYKLSVPRE